MKRTATKSALLALCVLMYIASCSRLLPWHASRKAEDLRIPQNHVLVWYPRYLVSNDDYSRLLSEKDLAASVIDIVRRADVLHIIDIDGGTAEGFIWYRVRLVREDEKTNAIEGWVLLRNAVRTHTQERAHNISRTLKRKER